MELKNDFSSIRAWAQERGLYAKGDTKTQFLKLSEEFGELGKAIMNQNAEEVKDAIGDMVVVLTNLTELANRDIFVQKDAIWMEKGQKRMGDIPGEVTIEECINSAYRVIQNRKGRMENGTFVKNREV